MAPDAEQTKPARARGYQQTRLTVWQKPHQQEEKTTPRAPWRTMQDAHADRTAIAAWPGLALPLAEPDSCP